MNLLFCTQKNPFGPDPVGGAETSSKLIAVSLSRIGHQVIYLTKHSSIPSDVVPNGIRLVHYKSFRGDSFFPIRWVNNILVFFALFSAVKKYKVDLIYCFYELKLLSAAILVKKFSNVKLVMRMAGFSWYDLIKNNCRLKNKYQNVFNKVDSINFIHESLEQEFYRKAKDAGMKISVSNSFSLDIGFNIPSRLKHDKAEVRDNNNFNLVMATRFSPHQKRQDILVKSIAALPKHIPVFLVFVGEGERRSSIEALVSELCLKEKIKFVDYLPQQDLWDLIRRSDLLCHSVEYEGLGKVIIESMALGTPVLVSNVIPMDAYVVDGYNGFLTDNSPSCWAKKIEEVYSDNELRSYVSMNALKFANEKYNSDFNVLLYETHFANLIDLRS